jgi:hypothetical protein
MGAARAAATAVSVAVAAGAPWAGVTLASTGDPVAGLAVGAAPTVVLAACAAAVRLRRRADVSSLAAPEQAMGILGRYRSPGMRSVAVAATVRGRTLTLTSVEGEVTGVPVSLASVAAGSCVIDLDVCGRLVFDDPADALKLFEEMI